MSNQFHTLEVKKVAQETTDAVSITFAVPDSLKDTFQYKQGQYLTLKFDLNGKEERRAYSMCSSPIEDGLTVTVKRVEKGKVSNHIADQVKVGNSVAVMPPEGRFFTQLDPDTRKTYYMFGAGSGITPLYSIIKTILEEEPMSSIHLFYGNRNEDGIIFKTGLENLTKTYTGQLTVEHILSQPKLEKPKGLTSFFKKGKPTWKGQIGRIDAANVARFLEQNPARNKSIEYFICGPGGMIDAVEKSLEARNIESKHIHTERFTTVDLPDTAKVSGVAGASATITLDGKTIQLDIPAGKNILDAMIDAKYDPPYSCTSGACSTCMAKVTKGNAKMDVCYALDDDEVEEGYILTCQAHPITEEIEVNFDV